MRSIEQEATKLQKKDFEALNERKRNETKKSVLAKIESEDESEDSGPEDILAMAAKKFKKKDVPTVDHSKIQYEEFNKKFYIEPKEMREMTEEEVEKLRIELDRIKIRGKGCPKPIKRWTHCGFPSSYLEVIRKQNFEKPTPIQAQAIPAIMSGRDVIGVAKTGSGKTLAFLLPMFRHIRDQRPLRNGDGPIAIIMTPTRELATQIHRECKPFLKASNLKAICAYGGAGMQNQINDIKRGAEIIVCTPGRMIDLLCANSGRLISLTRVTFLVLDEADRMFDMGFEPQIMKIINNTRADRQTVLFSATFPKQMEALARKTLSEPLEIIVGARSVVAGDIHQIVEVIEEKAKFTRLLAILGEFYQNASNSDFRVLIFVDKQEAADNLLKDLIHKGYPCLSLHGGKDQEDRDEIFNDFKSGAVQILIATSIAARGLDVKKLAVVVNYECPNHMEDYVHRVGRTGRAGNKGTAYTFITPAQDRYANDIVKALKASEAKIPKELQALADEFQLKVNQGNAQISGSGFGGKGLDVLDKQRDLLKFVQKQTYKNEGDDSSSDEEDNQTFNRIMGENNPLVKKENTGISGVTSGLPGINPAMSASEQAAAIRAAQIAAAKISATVVSANRNKELAEMKAKLRGDLGQFAHIGEGLDHAMSTASHFHQEIEINDFPQKARWKVTNKEQITQVIELSGAGVTVRGEYIPPGETLPVNTSRRKLHLVIESDNERAVELAVREIKRLLQESTISAFEAEARGGPSSGLSGRYSVL
ncbi:P-loop containing nucleoside triphosphate hydrolase protein [Neoconidiobolus thromboides FSU 785]|nr:P-loop containing nucleoside triphosphate hydrolase protein [Neoconidiobolus thromboides FSU 785]